jgi:hypothetical protein
MDLNSGAREFHDVEDDDEEDQRYKQLSFVEDFVQPQELVVVDGKSTFLIVVVRVIVASVACQRVCQRRASERGAARSKGEARASRALGITLTMVGVHAISNGPSVSKTLLATKPGDKHGLVIAISNDTSDS